MFSVNETDLKSLGLAKWVFVVIPPYSMYTLKLLFQDHQKNCCFSPWFWTIIVIVTVQNPAAEGGDQTLQEQLYC